MQSAMTQFCPHLVQRAVQNVLIPDWPTKLPTLTRSLLLAHRDLTYLLPLYDGMTIYMVPTIQQMHLGRTIKVAMAKVRAHRRHGDTLAPCRRKRRRR